MHIHACICMEYRLPLLIPSTSLIFSPPTILHYKVQLHTEIKIAALLNVFSSLATILHDIKLNYIYSALEQYCVIPNMGYALYVQLH